MIHHIPVYVDGIVPVTIKALYVTCYNQGGDDGYRRESKGMQATESVICNYLKDYEVEPLLVKYPEIIIGWCSAYTQGWEYHLAHEAVKEKDRKC